MPLRGEIWLFEPDPVQGREQAGVRSGVIISIDEFNQSSRELLIVVPLSTRERPSSGYPFHVAISPEQSGLRAVSYAMCEQIRAVSLCRVFGRRPRGRVHKSIMAEIQDAIRILLDL